MTQTLCFTSLFCLETTALAFVLYMSHHYQSLNRSRRQGDTDDEAADRVVLLCLYWSVLEWTGLFVRLIYMRVDSPVLPLAFSSSLWLPSSAPRWMVKRRLSWRITSRLCFTFGHPKHPTANPCRIRYLSPSAPPAPFLHQSRAHSSQAWHMIILLINYNGKQYDAVTSTCACDLCSWYMYCLMHIIKN